MSTSIWINCRGLTENELLAFVRDDGIGRRSNDRIPAIGNRKEVTAMAVLKIGDSWYAKFPVSRKPDGKIKYKQKKVGYSKKLAEQYDRKMYDEFYRREI